MTVLASLDSDEINGISFDDLIEKLQNAKEEVENSLAKKGKKISDYEILVYMITELGYYEGCEYSTLKFKVQKKKK